MRLPAAGIADDQLVYRAILGLFFNQGIDMGVDFCRKMFAGKGFYTKSFNTAAQGPWPIIPKKWQKSDTI
ncbi:MAG: hypothetical protein KKA54_11015 [Proteobacteria bacterium]|nr:hypothetical protein [Pseudomonadota bacterium]MBU0966894.1 hypothetical protein [Pseudomonadota bacterium]